MADDASADASISAAAASLSGGIGVDGTGASTGGNDSGTPSGEGGFSQSLQEAMGIAVQSGSAKDALSEPAVIAQLQNDGVDIGSFIASMLGSEPGGGKNPQLDPASKEAAAFRSGTNKGVTDLALQGFWGKDTQKQAEDAITNAGKFNEGFFQSLFGISKQAGMGKDGTWGTDIFASVDPLAIAAGLVLGPIAGKAVDLLSKADVNVALTANTLAGQESRGSSSGGQSGQGGDNSGGGNGDGSGVSVSDGGASTRNALDDLIDDGSGTTKDKPLTVADKINIALSPRKNYFYSMPDFELLNGKFGDLSGEPLSITEQNQMKLSGLS